MDPTDIELSNLNKNFEYAKFCSEINSLDDITQLKTIAKCYFKLYLKQQEVVIDIASSSL